MSLDITTLENWLWDAACAILGPVDAPKFKDYILPLIFLKRLSDVFEDELARLTEEYGDPQVATHIVEEERERGIVADSRGSGSQGSNCERDIRKAFGEADPIEAVVLLLEAEEERAEADRGLNEVLKHLGLSG